ncbi:MAG TPA: phosphatidylinositol-specific phospholipase C1-like protein [Bryobacteraceae bacterium]|nr:phosphatidylinositol-specific phospholipase C1-like protein [Bryobacteraceae bacterium]
MLRFLLALLTSAVFLYAQSSAEDARLNQIQVLGSHNSYKRPMDPGIMNYLKAKNPKTAMSLDYSHQPFEKQLDSGLRALEIDVVNDPKGGLFAKPGALERLKKSGLAVEPYDPEGLMLKPGLKVLHDPDVDFRSHVYTFRQALEKLKAWSEAHPRHLPIVITMNAKDDGGRSPDLVKPLPFDAPAFDAWDAEIREVLPPSKLITPDDVRGKYPTLEAAVLAHAWPTIGQSRGKFLFVLDEQGEKLKTYVNGHPSLKGRVMFVNAPEGTPESAVLIMNEPIEQLTQIQYLVRSGYFVRTRADAETVEARKGDYSRWKAALASGAQIISTDYYVADERFGTGYRVQLPGGAPGRWNTLLLPEVRPLPALE